MESLMYVFRSASGWTDDDIPYDKQSGMLSCGFCVFEKSKNKTL
jgi:hypothetical protein